MLGIDHHLVARQMCRQCAMVAGGAIGARVQRPIDGWFGRVLPGLVLGNRLLQILEAKPQLLVGQLFGATTKLVARQTLEQQPQFVVLSV